MGLPRTKASEEVQAENIASYNHAKLVCRLGKSFGRYDTQYDILPELEFELSHGRAKPGGTVTGAATGGLRKPPLFPGCSTWT